MDKNFKEHISSNFKVASKNLTQDACHKLVLGLVIIRLNCGNRQLAGMPIYMSSPVKNSENGGKIEVFSFILLDNMAARAVNISGFRLTLHTFSLASEIYILNISHQVES